MQNRTLIISKSFLIHQTVAQTYAFSQNLLTNCLQTNKQTNSSKKIVTLSLKRNGNHKFNKELIFGGYIMLIGPFSSSSLMLSHLVRFLSTFSLSS